MSINGKAYIVGAFEHPTRKADDKSVAQLHAEVARGALEDAGLSKDDIDGYFCTGAAPGLGPLNMADYLGLTKLRHLDSTDVGGSSYVLHVGHAAEQIALGRCNVALITLAGRPRAEAMATGTAPRSWGVNVPDDPFEIPYGRTVANVYAMCAMRHMHEFGTTSEQLAWIKVAASHHAQHNPHAMLQEGGDGGGGGRLADDRRPAAPARLLRDLRRRRRGDRGAAGDRAEPQAADGEGAGRGRGDQEPGRRATSTSPTPPPAGPAPRAFEEAGVKPADIQYASIYDSFTITVLMQIEDLGFCEKGQGGRFVSDGNLISRRRQAALQHRWRRARATTTRRTAAA